MSVKIGHASIDERGKVSGGSAGDQSVKEVCTRSWYNKGWSVLLRPKSATVAEKMAAACEAGCANPKIGYDQYQRNTLRVQAKAANWNLAKITTACETDCSAFMTVCAEAAGVDVSSCYTSGNAPVTSTMRAKFKATGAFEVLTASKYLTSPDYLKRGDVLVYEKGHTVMVLSNGSKAGNGTSAAATTSAPAKTPGKLEVDGQWGKDTTKRLQEIFGTPVDGKISNQWASYEGDNPGLVSGWDWKPVPNGKGSQLIKALQKWAGMPLSAQDGEIGPGTIKALQKKLGTVVDGKVSNPSQMVKALQTWANNQ